MTQAKAIRIHAPGGPEALRLEPVTVNPPGIGEALVRQTAIGVNFIDIYHRTGLYKLPSYPATLGVEAAGVVESVGPACLFVKPGDRVAYATAPVGAYATHRVVAEKFLVKLPDEISDETGAAMMLKGLTAHYLIRRTFVVTDKVTLLVHAAAGGVGLILCQWAKRLGATVIGTVGSEEKAAIAKANGCDHVILLGKENLAERVRAVTGGKMVHCVYDSIGKDSFMDSLDCLMKFGIMVSYGQSSGPVPPLDVGLLARKGSLFLTRPTLFDYKADPTELLVSCGELFEVVISGAVKIHIGQRYRFENAAEAHRDLEARKTKGASVLAV